MTFLTLNLVVVLNLIMIFIKYAKNNNQTIWKNNSK